MGGVVFIYLFLCCRFVFFGMWVGGVGSVWLLVLGWRVFILGLREGGEIGVGD